MSFITQKANLNSPIVRKLLIYQMTIFASFTNRHLKHDYGFQVNCYPSKPIGLYTKQSVIFRTDSHAKVLEGYAGAGLHDREEVFQVGWKEEVGTSLKELSDISHSEQRSQPSSLTVDKPNDRKRRY
ncbi:uncharacterized protein LOC121050685 [Rosa chinensis]|uniref:uncharacterized protein LOC121050685 n=1 Tax=Rosa chinensis TaxID=74649 RepID=UPI001AD8BAA5|nr:uncharacterized protein LOC121050685 [Rosa chinensis]